MNKFLTRIKSPVVLSGILTQGIAIALVLGATPEDVEMWRLVIVGAIQIYNMLFVATNNPTTKNTY